MEGGFCPVKNLAIFFSSNLPTYHVDEDRFYTKPLPYITLSYLNKTLKTSCSNCHSFLFCSLQLLDFCSAALQWEVGSFVEFRTSSLTASFLRPRSAKDCSLSWRFREWKFHSRNLIQIAELQPSISRNLPRSSPHNTALSQTLLRESSESVTTT